MKKISILGMISLALLASPLQNSTVNAENVDQGYITYAVAENNSRIYGENRYQTAIAISKAGWSTAETAILSAGMDENLVDALTAAPLAKAKNAPILLTEGDTLNQATKDELIRLNAKTVYITSGLGTIKQPVLDQLRELGLTIIPLGGKDRFETSLNIAKELPFPKSVAITTAWTNADALSIASIAAAKGMPILLTNPSELPQNITNYLNSTKSTIETTFVLGKEGAVSDSVKAQLKNPVRLGGTDRYETNREILNQFINETRYEKVYIANGENNHLVDALSGSPLAAKTSSPVVLVHPGFSDQGKEFVKLNMPFNLVTLGGENVVPESLITALQVTETITDNATLRYSALVDGDNATIQNVNMGGTLFIAANSSDLITLSNIRAKAIVIMSETNTGFRTQEMQIKNIKIDNVKTDNLRLQAPGIAIEVSGSSEISKAIIKDKAKLNLVGGTITDLEIAPDNLNDEISLSGEYKNIAVRTPSNTILQANSSVQNLVSYSNAKLSIEKNVTVSAFDKKGNNVELTGEGAASLGTVPAVPVAGGGVIGAPTTGLSSVVQSMELNINGTRTLPYTLSGSKATVDLKEASLQDFDVIQSTTINLSQGAVLHIDRTLLTPEVNKNLNIGSNTLTLSDMGIPDRGDDGAKYTTITSYLGSENSISGKLILNDGKEIPISILILN